jgi:hypothetical protein
MTIILSLLECERFAPRPEENKESDLNQKTAGALRPRFELDIIFCVRAHGFIMLGR